MLRAFASKYQITEEEHTCMLAQLNWSKQEWDEGVKRSAKALRLSPALPTGSAKLFDAQQT